MPSKETASANVTSQLGQLRNPNGGGEVLPSTGVEVLPSTGVEVLPSTGVEVLPSTGVEVLPSTPRRRPRPCPSSSRLPRPPRRVRSNL